MNLKPHTDGFPRAWEPVENDLQSERLQVPGGWLVRNTWFQESGNGISVSGSITFLPDNSWLWKFKSPAKE